MTEPVPPAEANDWFRPTWGRGLFALALAIGGFLLPQEVPLEWYPLNEPGTDINYLEISCAADRNSQVQIFYDLTHGFNELNSIRFPISPTEQTFTYTFPLPDAPITGLRMDPLAEEGSLRIGQMRIINRRNEEIIRFTRDMFRPDPQIASIDSTPDGWKFTAAAKATDPQSHVDLRAPIVPVGMNHRNLLRCLLSTGYLAGMLFILLLAVLTALWRPRSWRDFLAPVGFMACLALCFALVGNRGLIRNSIHYARFVPPAIPPGLSLEFDLVSSGRSSAQLFWRTEKDFKEAQSSLQALEPHQGIQILRFPLPLQPVQALRFDPRDNPGSLHIRAIRVVDAGQRTLAVLPLDSLQTEAGITKLEATANELIIQTAPSGGDPITHLRGAAVELINKQIVATGREAATRRAQARKSRPAATPVAAVTRWTMLNVTPKRAQADCHLIEFPDGTKTLIDAAEAADSGHVLLPYLQEKHIARLDLVVISHFHRDHYGRLKDLLEAGVKIDRVAYNLPASRETADRENPWGMDWDEVQALLQWLRDKGVSCFNVAIGDKLVDITAAEGTPVRLEVLHVHDGVSAPVGPTDVNDTSIVARLTHGPTRVLFTGDLNHLLGAWLATSQVDLRADILKAPHHGGEGHPPNEFYDRVGPQTVMVSTSKDLWTSVRCARMRTYVQDHKLPHFVTGMDGTVSVEFTSEGYVISSEKQREGLRFRPQAR